MHLNQFSSNLKKGGKNVRTEKITKQIRKHSFDTDDPVFYRKETGKYSLFRCFLVIRSFPTVCTIAVCF